jgi:hypothetical protein
MPTTPLLDLPKGGKTMFTDTPYVQIFTVALLKCPKLETT